MSLIDILTVNEYVKSGENIQSLVMECFIQDRVRREYDDDGEPWAYYCTKYANITEAWLKKKQNTFLFGLLLQPSL